MVTECIICGVPVKIEGNPEIIVCQKDNCLHTVENNIGLHYQTGQAIYDVIPYNFNLHEKVKPN